MLKLDIREGMKENKRGKEKIVDSHKNIVFAYMFHDTKEFKLIPEEVLLFLLMK